jgi:hypothetical protein
MILKPRLFLLLFAGFANIRYFHLSISDKYPKRFGTLRILKKPRKGEGQSPLEILPTI